MENNKISVNIWDDYHDDGYVPDGETQDTYAYVECDLESDKQKEVLLVLKEHIEKIYPNASFEMELSYYDSAKVYPSLVGTEYEYSLYKRWQLQFKHFSHKVREDLVEKLQNLHLTYLNIPVDIYSES